MLEAQLPMAMGLALQQPLSALQQLLGLALAHHQARHLLHRTHALSSCHQNLTASPLLHDDMLSICLSGQARLALHQPCKRWQKPQPQSTIATVFVIIIIVQHAVMTESCNLQHEQ